ncbi:MAG TPA: carbamoyltransferase N-terminal domain-containing protein, partial [Candidatus Omnitrophota bacterium]|nr:carbamoyltransferase N-terminal domain-containing protein [Candidatus Omnitrophota bacterium]
MYILGLSCYYHDSAACLIKDGVLIAAASEERFTKVKHDPSFPKNAINFCLSKEGISPSELDHVVFHEKPFLKFDRIARSILSSYPFSFGLFFESLVQWFKVKLWIKSTISEFLSIKEERILFCQHHLSHAASAFFCSPFKEAAILTCDGAGEWQTTTLGKG